MIRPTFFLNSLQKVMEEKLNLSIAFEDLIAIHMIICSILFYIFCTQLITADPVF